MSFKFSLDGTPYVERKVKNTFIRDIERCPYMPFDEEYAEWDRKDAERLNKISEARTELCHRAYEYLSHDDRNIRNMAIFIIGFLED